MDGTNCPENTLGLIGSQGESGSGFWAQIEDLHLESCILEENPKNGKRKESSFQIFFPTGTRQDK